MASGTCTLNSGTSLSSGGNSGYRLAAGTTVYTTTGPFSASPGYPYKITAVSVPWFGYSAASSNITCSGTVTVKINGYTLTGTLGSTTFKTNTNVTGTISCTGTAYVASGTSYTVSVTCSGSNLAKTGSRFGTNGKSLTITYSPLTYTVAYNANGHGSAPASLTKTAGTTLTLLPYIATNYSSESTVTITANKNGATWSGSNGSAKWRYTYTLGGWNTNSSGTGTNYGSKGSYTANAGATLYAKWSSSAGGTSYTLPTGTPTKANGTTAGITVTFNANGGSTTKASLASYKTVTYSFSGWYTASSGGTKRTTSSRVTAAETVYALFSSTTSSTYGAVTCPSASLCTRSGYSLKGWSTSSTATSASYSAGGSYTPTAAITLYAVWSLDTATITLSQTTPSAYYKILPSQTYINGQYDSIPNTILYWKKFRFTENALLAKFGDGYFSGGVNGITSYVNNSTSGNGTSTVSRVSKLDDNPFSNSSHELKVAVSKNANTAYIGFVLPTLSAANKVFLHIFVAKLSSGYSFLWASNSTGTGRTVTWLTPRSGTGKYEVYAYLHNCGSEGTFSNFGHVYVTPNNLAFTLNFYIAYSEVFDISDTQSFTFSYGSTTPSLPIPYRPGYKFVGWARPFGDDQSTKYIKYGRSYMYTNKYSIHFKANKSDWSTYGREIMISCTEGGGWGVGEYSTGSSGLYTEAYDEVGGTYRGTNASSVLPFSLMKSGWHTIDIIFNGTNIKMYIDLQLVATSANFSSNKIKYNTTNGIFWAAEPGSSPDTPQDGYYFLGTMTAPLIRNTDTLYGENNMLISVPALNMYLYSRFARTNHINVYHAVDESDPSSLYWEDCPFYVFHNGAWEKAQVKAYDSSAWKNS